MVGRAPFGSAVQPPRLRSAAGRSGRSTSGASRDPAGSRRSGLARVANVQPLRKTSPPSNQLTKTSSSGAGMSKCSPYISSSGRTKDSSSPSASGCDGSTTQSRSRLAVLAPLQVAGRAHQPLEDLREVPRVEDDEAHPVEDARVDAIDDRVAHLVVGGVAPPDQGVGRGEHSSVRPCSGSSSVAIGRRDPVRRGARLRSPRGSRRDRSPGPADPCAPGGIRSRS